jgi:hypothetical protein
LIYKSNNQYTASYDVLIFLRFLNIDFDILTTDTTKPILSKYVIEENNKGNKRICFEKWVDTQ